MGGDQQMNKWHSGKSWHEVESNEFDFLSTYLSETIEVVADQLNKTLYNLLPKIIDFVESKKFELKIPVITNNQKHVVSGTGITNNHFFVFYNTSASGSV